MRQNVVTVSKEVSYGYCHDVQFSMCNHTFEWRIDHFVKGKTEVDFLHDFYDVTPALPSFQDIDFDPYMDCHAILAQLSPSLSGGHLKSMGWPGVVDNIVSHLIDSVVKNQREKVKLLTRSLRSSLFLDMLENFPHQDDIYYLVYRMSHCGGSSTLNGREVTCSTPDPHVVVQFPLLEMNRLSVPELEYLVQMLSSSSPPLSVTVTLSSSDISLLSSFSTKPTLSFPSQHLPNLRNVVLPQWDPVNGTLYDYLPAIEKTISETWGQRKRFVTELQRVASVTELDPVDFSFVSLSLRLTSNKHFTLAIVDLRIPSNLLASPILLLIHDLMSGASYPLEGRGEGGISSPTFFSSAWGPERMAREYFLCLCEEIKRVAFGEDNGSGSSGSY